MNMKLKVENFGEKDDFLNLDIIWKVVFENVFFIWIFDLFKYVDLVDYGIFS